jgi:hypothetical protein
MKGLKPPETRAHVDRTSKSMEHENCVRFFIALSAGYARVYGGLSFVRNQKIKNVFVMIPPMMTNESIAILLNHSSKGKSNGECLNRQSQLARICED